MECEKAQGLGMSTEPCDIVLQPVDAPSPCKQLPRRFSRYLSAFSLRLQYSKWYVSAILYLINMVLNTSQVLANCLCMTVSDFPIQSQEAVGV